MTILYEPSKAEQLTKELNENDDADPKYAWTYVVVHAPDKGLSKIEIYDEEKVFVGYI